MMSTNPVYADVVKKGQEDPDALFLDLGCCSMSSCFRISFLCLNNNNAISGHRRA